MRNAEDMQELDDRYRDEEAPPRACPECGDDDRHAPDCSRNYRNIKPMPVDDPREAHTPRGENYWLGYRHGRRLASDTTTDYEPMLVEELKYAVGSDRTITERHRAFALGVLRGYREAQNDRP